MREREREREREHKVRISKVETNKKRQSIIT
jgi:hypothetical protein